jgi:ABC-type lipoprotein release transport system permease subunit
MAQNGKQFSGVAVKGIDPGDAKYMSKLVKEGSIDVLRRKGSVLMGKELAKHLGLFVGDSFTIMVPSRLLSHGLHAGDGARPRGRHL